MDANLMNLLLALIALIIGSGGVYLIRFLSNKIGQDKLTTFYQLAKTIVMALEQTNSDMAGIDKKSLAVAKLVELTGGKISEADADRLIEAAVYEVKKLLNNTTN